jgi:hypothetical protein
MAMYPNSLPLAEIQSLISIVKGGQIVQDRAKFALDLWWVQGYAQRALLGLPEGSDMVMAQKADMTPLEVLELVAANAEDGQVLAPQAAIPWQLLLSWALEELKKLLATWLAK